MRQLLKDLTPFIIAMLGVIILSTAIIIFAEQYKFNPVTGTFVQTGMIEVLGIDNAKVYMDGKEQGTSPKTINFVDPGDHKIRVEKDSRAIWERTVHVSPGKVTTLFPILFPQEDESTEITTPLMIIPTSSPYSYLTIEFINGATELHFTELSRRLLDIGVKSTKVAGLNQIIENVDITEENVGQPPANPNSGTNPGPEEIKEKLTKLSFKVSPKGKYTLITDVTNNKTEKENKIVYLAELGQNNVKNVSAWFDLAVDTFYWSPDEDWIIVKSQTLIISINLKTGQRFILYNLSESKQYGPITPIKGGVIFVVNEINNSKNTARIFRIDNDGKNLQESQTPENNFSMIKSIFAIENAGILLINADNSIWKLTSIDKPPTLLKEGHEVIWADSDERWACSINLTSQTEGVVFHFNPMDPDLEIKIKYPMQKEEINRISLINGHQNIVFQTKDNIVITTEDGENVITILKNKDLEKYKAFFLSAIYHRDIFLFRYGVFKKTDETESTTEESKLKIKEIRFQN